MKRNPEKNSGLYWIFELLVFAYLLSQQANGPLLSCPQPLVQTKAKYKAIDIKRIVYSHSNKTHFHKKKRFQSQHHFKSDSSWNSQMAWFIPSWLVNSSAGDTIALVKGLNPTQTWIFFQAFFCNCKSFIYNCDDLLYIYLLIHPAVRIYDFHIFI